MADSQELSALLGRLMAPEPTVTKDDIKFIADAIDPVSSVTSPDLGLLALATLGKAAERSPAVADSIIAAGLVPELKRMAANPKLRVKEALGALCLPLTTGNDDAAKARREAFVKDGGFTVLLSLVNDLIAPPEGDDTYIPPDPTLLLSACSAYAKILRGTSPSDLSELFATPVQETIPPALVPLYVLIAYPATTRAHALEALTALAPLAITHPVIGSRIVSDSVSLPPTSSTGNRTDARVIEKIEHLLMDRELAISRAAINLVGMLVNSKGGWYRFSGETSVYDFPAEAHATESDTPTQQPKGRLDPQAAARLGVILLLTDSDDRATRQSAATALGILTQSECACSALIQLKIKTSAGTMDTGLWARVADLFEANGQRPPADTPGARARDIGSAPPDPSLAFSGTMIAYNLLMWVKRFFEPQRGETLREAKAGGLVEALKAGEGSWRDERAKGWGKTALEILNSA